MADDEDSDDKRGCHSIRDRAQLQKKRMMKNKHESVGRSVSRFRLSIGARMWVNMTEVSAWFVV